MDTPDADAILNLFLRHCVFITGYNSTGPAPIPFVISGFVISVDNEWFLVTAGHCLREIDEARKIGQTHEHWQLDDCARPNALHKFPIPFAFDAADKFNFDDVDDLDSTGIDYAAIHMRPYYRALLAANGVIPFENPWRRDRNAAHDKYILIGAPAETINPTSPLGDMAFQYQPSLIDIQRIAQPSVGQKTGDWFYGKLPLPEEAPRLASVKGMSGGPIVGLAWGEDGNLRYWLIALQSSWYPTSREIRGCPIDTFALWLGKVVNDHISGAATISTSS